MRVKKTSSKPQTPNRPIELSDQELETVCGGGPHVRVFNGSTDLVAP